MIRKTLWRALTVLTILSMAVPFVYAAPSAQPPPPEQAETMLPIGSEQMVEPKWAKMEEMTAPTALNAIEAYEHEYEWTGSTAIPDYSCSGGTGISLTLNVLDSFAVTDLVVGFNADHTWRSDVQARLTSPANTPVVLLAGTSGSSADNFDVLFADGGNSVSTVNHDHTLSPFYDEDTWAPVDPLSGFAAENAQGTWTLYVCDDANGDTGTVHRWALFFNEVAVPDYSGSTKTADADFGNWLITYTVAIENSGQASSANVYLTDTIPANTGYLASSALASSGTITEGVGYLEWGGAVLSQTTEYLTFTVGILGAPLYETAITNTACISDPMALGEVCTGVVIVTPAFVPDLSTSVKETVPDNAEGERRAVVGTQFPYTITVSNTGVANATNAMLTDDLPTGSATYVAASAWADSGALIVASDMLTWTGVVTNGEDVQIGFMMDAISLGLEVDNTAWITGDGTLLDLDAPTVGIQNPNAYCEGAIALDPSSDTFVGAIVDPDDDDGFWGSGNDVWFTVTPTATGVVTLTVESDNDSDIGIGTSDGGCGGMFNDLDTDYGSLGVGSVTVNVNYNQLYYITVDDDSNYTLTLEAEYELLQPRLDGWKEGPALVVAGDPIPYTVYAENYGEISAAAASIVDTFPSGTVGPAMNVVVDGPGSIVANDAGGLEWNGTLNSLEGVTITFELSPTVPCLEPIMTNTAVISDPAVSMAVVVEAPPVDTVIEFYLGEGFEGAFPPAGWTNEVVVATGSPTWTQETGTLHPAGYLPHGGSYMARFNSYSVANGGAARLSSSSVDLSMATDPEVSFWMFHDNEYSSNTDRIQVQVSIDGGTVFTDVGAEILRYDSSGDFWMQHVVDLTDYVGESDVIVGFLAISGYGDDIYLDDVTISSPCPAVELSMIKSGPDTAVMGEVMIYTILVENLGVIPATGVELTDYLDLGTSYAGGAFASHGTLDDSLGTLAMGIITWSGNITYGESLMITIPVTASGECGSIVTNTAVVTHTSLDVELEDSAATMLVYSEPSLEQGFEGAWLPTDWLTSTTGAADDPGWLQTTSRVHSGDYAAYHADDDTDGDSISWLIMPQFTPSALSQFSFWQNENYAGYYEYHGIWVSTATSDPADFVELVELGPGTEDTWEQVSVSLSDYTGQAIYVAFYYAGDYADEWFIDDVSIADVCPAVLIGPDQSQALCPENGPAVYNLDVSNMTPNADTVNLTLEDVDWAGTTVYPAALALAAGETGMITVTVPISGATGDNDEINVVAAGSVYSDAAVLNTSVGLAKEWTFKADSLRGARFLAVVYDDDRLYQIGGYDGSAVSDTHAYNIAGDYWLTMTGMITGVYYIDGAAIDGNIYVPGGQSASNGYNAFVQVYSTTDMIWSTVAPMPHAQRGHDVVALDGLLYVIGGYDGGYTNTLYVYTPTTGIWGTLAPMSNARAYASAGVIDGKIYVAGGYDGSGMDSLEIYDPATGVWSDGADLPEPWVSAADGVKYDRFLILSGGADSTFTASNGAWMYDAVNDAWSQMPLLNTQRYGAEGDGDGSNYYMIAGREYDGSFFYSTSNERLLQCGECESPDDASFTYAPPAPGIGETVTFNGSVGTGTGDLVYTWDFGDGGVGTGMDVTHVYTDAGDFVVELTVTNDCGMDIYTDTVSTMWPCESLDIDKSGPLTATSGSVIQMQVVISSAFFAPGTVLTDVLPVGMEYAGNVDATEGTAWYDAGAVYWTTDEPIPEMPVAGVLDKEQAKAPVRSLPAFESIAEDEEIAKGTLVTLKGNGQALAGVPVQAHAPSATTLLEEGFEAGVMPPAGGWSVVDTNSTRNWDLVDAVTYPDFVRTGDYAGWVNYVDIESSDEWLLTPDIDLTGISAATLEFWGLSATAWCPSGGTGATMLLHVTDTGGTPLATLWDLCTDTAWDGSAYEQVVVDLSAYAGQTVKVAWQYVGIDGDSFGLDDILLTAETGSVAQPITITFDVTIMASSGLVTNTVDAEYCNGIVSDTHTLEVWSSCNPVTSVSFDYSPAAPETDETVTFTGAVNDGTLVLPVDYSWDFGGLIKYGNPVTNTYAISNTYAVTVEATNPCTVVPATYTGYVTVISVDEMYYIYLPLVLK